MEDIERRKISLAKFYCEEVQNFKLEECFSIFIRFIQSYKKAIKVQKISSCKNIPISLSEQDLGDLLTPIVRSYIG